MPRRAPGGRARVTARPGVGRERTDEVHRPKVSARYEHRERDQCPRQHNDVAIEAAADEAGISRLYGGIHFRSAIVNGKEQGRKVGSLFTPLLH